MTDLTSSFPANGNPFKEKQGPSYSNVELNFNSDHFRENVEPVVNRRSGQLSPSGRKRYGMMEFGNVAMQDSLLLQEFDPLLVGASASSSLETTANETPQALAASKLHIKNENIASKDNTNSKRSSELVLGFKETSLTNSSGSSAGQMTSGRQFEPRSSSEVRGPRLVNHRTIETSESDDELDAASKKGVAEMTLPKTNSAVRQQKLTALADDFHDISRHRILSVAGDDKSGRAVVVFSACRIPPYHQIDHTRLFRYLLCTLDQYVENDYTIVYFHYGLTSKNKPAMSRVINLYRDLDRKYRKNIKALFVVHPSSTMKLIWATVARIASPKFSKKLLYITRLQDLAEYVHLDQIDIPTEVMEHDVQISSQVKPVAPKAPSGVFYATPAEIPKTQQFGVSLSWMRENNNGECIPPVVATSVKFLQENALEVEGIFRRSANQRTVKDIIQVFNLGHPVEYSQQDIYCAAVIIKRFLRELPEPILTFKLYDRVIAIPALPDETEKLKEMWRILHYELPDENFTLLKFLMEFLNEVLEHSDLNKMTAKNLAIVFGPNLVWSRAQAASLDAMGQINTFSLLLLENVGYLFGSR